MIGVKQAAQVAAQNHKGETLAEIVDLGSTFGFVFVPWNEKKDGPITRTKAFTKYFIVGWTTVDKKTGRIGLASAQEQYDKFGKYPPIIG